MKTLPLETADLPVTADDMAAFLGLATPLSVADTALLEGMIGVAADMVRKYTNREFVERKYSATYVSSDFPDVVGELHRESDGFTGRIVLPMAPVMSIEKIYAIDWEGTETEITTTGFYTKLDIEPAEIDLLYLPCANRIRVEFTAGYEDLYDVPPEMLLAVKMIVARLYEMRGTCDSVDVFKTSGCMPVLQNVMVRFGL